MEEYDIEISDLEEAVVTRSDIINGINRSGY